MKQPSSNRATQKSRATGVVQRSKKPGTHRRNKAHLKANPNPTTNEDCLAHDQSVLEKSDSEKFEKLPKEIGVMLIAAGVVGLVLPGPGTPALIAGGLALWPGAFGKLELWLEHHHPVAHQRSMKQIGRFLDDLERRYPYSDHK